MKKIIAFIGILIILGGIFMSYFMQAAWFSKERAGDSITVVVTENMDPSDVRDQLVQSGLISAPLLFDFFLMMSDSGQHPKPGEYSFRTGASYRHIVHTMALGPPRNEVTIRLGEGKTLDENAEELRSYDIDPDAYLALVGKSRNAHAFDRSLEQDFDILRGIPNGQSLEGYLFPDTYNVWKDQLPAGLVRKQLRTFIEKVVIPYELKRQSSGMTWHEVLTLASIVEAEVQKTEDKRIVAGVFLTRLGCGMRLQSDATLNYAIDEGRTRATLDDLQLNSPYNSYRRDGLPPGPINNPSLSSILAVLEPIETDYLFFLTDEEGRVYYAESLEGHQQNRVEAYGS